MPNQEADKNANSQRRPFQQHPNANCSMHVNSTCMHLALQGGANVHPHSPALLEAEDSILVFCRCSTHAFLARTIRSCCVPEADAMNVLKCSAYLEVVFRSRWLLFRFFSFSSVVVRTSCNVHVGDKQQDTSRSH